MSKMDKNAEGHWQGMKHVHDCGFQLGAPPIFKSGRGHHAKTRCAPCMVYALAYHFYGARDILHFDSVDGVQHARCSSYTHHRTYTLPPHNGYAIGEYSADLGESAVLRPISMKRREAGDGLTPATVALFEKIICKRVNEQRRLDGKPIRVERVQSSHGGRRGAVKNAVDVARQKGQVVDYIAVCKDLR